MKVVLATQNKGKLRELSDLWGDLQGIEFVLAPEGFNPDETGHTFVENAIIKAKAASLMTGLHALADDSGIEVYCLDRRPGIHSARYIPGTDEERMRALLKEVLDLNDPNRGAAFVCAMALCAPSGEVLNTAEARWEGEIADSERGVNGFGYDPIFYLKERGLTAAELPAAEKNILSHRAQAFRLMQKYLERTRLPQP